jgi:hypothetical protein
MESSELRRISYLQDTVYFSNLNNTVLLGESLNSDNKKYLINELADINKIEEVSVKSKNKEQNSEIIEFGIKTKTSSGKNSIYVEALQSISNSRKLNPSQGFSFNLKDPLTGNLIRSSTMLEAHISCGNEIYKLPRVI